MPFWPIQAYYRGTFVDHVKEKWDKAIHISKKIKDGFAVIKEASHHDSSRMIALCAGLQEGEIAVFDKAYMHFKNLSSLTQRGVHWVTRAKDNMSYHVCKKRKVGGSILRDDEITLQTKTSKQDYPQRLRRILARVKVDGKEVEMVFIINNLSWAASSVCDLLRFYGTAGGQWLSLNMLTYRNLPHNSTGQHMA